MFPMSSPSAGRDLIFLAVLIVLVRPLSVFVSLLGSPLNLRERAFIAGLAPRGIVAAAVSSVFALELEQRSGTIAIPNSDQLATVTLFVIVGTVAVYGLAASPLARWLGLADEKTNGVLIAGADAWIRDFAKELKKVPFGGRPGRQQLQQDRPSADRGARRGLREHLERTRARRSSAVGHRPDDGDDAKR